MKTIKEIMMEFIRTWGGVNFSNTIAPCDKEALKKYLTKIESRSLAEPLHGNPEAGVYLLNGNPGSSARDLDFVGNTQMEERFRKALNFLDTRMMWLENSETIKDSLGRSYPAYEYFKRHFREVLKKKEDPDFCLIEYFPYHSKKSFSYPKHLPSYDCIDDLIRHAIASDKLIIIMRQKRTWMERIPELATYKNCICVNSCQSAYISEKNLSRCGRAWDDIVSRF